MTLAEVPDAGRSSKDTAVLVVYEYDCNLSENVYIRSFRFLYIHEHSQLRLEHGRKFLTKSLGPMWMRFSTQFAM